MGKTLIITEKNTVAVLIAKAIGGFRKVGSWLESDNAILAPAAGHLVEQYSEQMAKAGRDISSLPIIPDKFDLKVIEKKSQFYSVLKQLMERPDVTKVANACDAGREGELIFRLIYRMAGCEKQMLRLWMRSTVDEAVRSAYANMRPGSEYDDLAAAAEIRSEGDYIVGINASRGITRLYERMTAKAETFPLGRVQTPVLVIVCLLELDILMFRPVPYWEVHAKFGVAAGEYIGKWMAPRPPEGDSNKNDHQPYRVFDRAVADSIINKCTNVEPSSVVDDTKPALKGPGQLYDLTGLQRDANRKHGFSGIYTEELAQKLYLNLSLTTYPRTDSAYLPDDAVEDARKTVASFTGTPYSEHAQRILDGGWVKPNKKIFDSTKVSDHSAIIPTGTVAGTLEPDVQTLYDMIVKRFLAVFHPPAEYAVTERITTVAEEMFRTTGRVLITPGWMAVYGSTIVDDDTVKDADSDDKKALAMYVEGETVTPRGIELKRLNTKPPVRFTEDTLLGAMETAGRLVEEEDLREAMKERGLGTPVTRAKIIESLLATTDKSGKKKEPYLIQDKKYLAPSPKGMTVVRFLMDNGIEALTSPALTGEWEYKLRLMEKGQYSRQVFKTELAELTTQILDIIKGKYAGVAVKKLQAPCPQCGGAVEVQSRTFACEQQCGFSIWRDILKRQLKVSEGETLVRDKLVLGLKGFVNPKKNNKKFDAGLRLLDDGKVEFYYDPTANTTDSKGNVVSCTKCNGPMRRIKSTKGYFWGCADRENCKHTMNDLKGDPVERPKSFPCDVCGKAMYLRNADKSPFWGCSGFVKGGGGCNNTLKDRDGTPIPKVNADEAVPSVDSERTGEACSSSSEAFL
ncbi:DNA topoisomerase [Pseudomonas abietaniphila]|uniref:DNA topoisomerase n=1 Tax=Pseudomonas abietaniphila TaxID=89065 RepID=A0A1G8RXD9_9PSED|nr:DNA topoisomerase [Pseudomonas abietaniphila]SDJ21618.1 DNA topoisomerase-3 [Pseudomonas abietaniphila]